MLPANQGFPITGPDGPAPIAGAIAQIVQNGWPRTWSALDELRAIAGDGGHLGVDVRRDVHDERRRGLNPKVNTEIIHNSLREVRSEGHVGLSSAERSIVQAGGVASAPAKLIVQ